MAYRTLVTRLDIRMPIEDPVRSVPKIGSAIGVSPRTTRRAQEILRMADAKGVTAGKDPMGLAGAALYIASHLMDGGGEDSEERRGGGRGDRGHGEEQVQGAQVHPEAMT